MFMKFMREYSVTATLLTGLICAIVVLIFRSSVWKEKLRKIVWNYRKVIIALAIMLIMLIPIVFSKLITKSLLSPLVLGVYIRELLLSIFAILFFTVGWFLPGYISRWHRSNSIQELFQPFKNVQGSSNAQTSVTLKQSEQLVRKLDTVVIAWEEGLIDQGDAVLAQEISSLEKWLIENDVTGFYELKEKVLYGEGLHSSTKLIIKRELEQIQGQNNGRAEKQKHLKFLISFHIEVIDVNNQLEFDVDEAVKHNMALYEERERKHIAYKIKKGEVSIHELLKFPQSMETLV